MLQYGWLLVQVRRISQVVLSWQALVRLQRRCQRGRGVDPYGQGVRRVMTAPVHHVWLRSGLGMWPRPRQGQGLIQLLFVGRRLSFGRSPPTMRASLCLLCEGRWRLFHSLGRAWRPWLLRLQLIRLRLRPCFGLSLRVPLRVRHQLRQRQCRCLRLGQRRLLWQWHLLLCLWLEGRLRTPLVRLWVRCPTGVDLPHCKQFLVLRLSSCRRRSWVVVPPHPQDRHKPRLFLLG